MSVTPLAPQAESVLCQVCRRANLTGGVRCAYCGAHFPSLDFDLTAPLPPPAESASDIAAPPAPKKRFLAGGIGILGTLGLLALKAKTFIALLNVAKILTTFGSMALFIVADAQLFGWKLGVGIAVSILIHEMGHVWVNWRRGIPQSAPMFIPFVGAMIQVKNFPNNPEAEAAVGAGGPIAGGFAAVGSLALGHLTGDPFYFTLAMLGFSLNLFNLVPFAFLDGARMGAVLSPKAWWAFLLVIALWALKMPAPALWLIILGTLLVRLTHIDSGRYLLATPFARARMAALFAVLAIGLSHGITYSITARQAMESSRPGVTKTVPGVSAPETPEAVAIERTLRARASQDDQDKERYSLGRWLVRGVVFGFIALLWWGALRRIGRAAGTRWGRGDSRTLTFMLAILLLIQTTAVLTTESVLSTGVIWSLIFANMAAAAVALIFGLVQAGRAGHKQIRPSAALLRLQMLAWGALAAFLVGYGASSGIVLLALGLATVAFFATQPAARYLSLSALASAIGDEVRAGRYLEQAQAISRDSDLTAALAGRRIVGLLDDERGEVVLPLLSAQADQEPQGVALFQYQDAQAAALTQVGRFGETLQTLEQMLQSARTEPRLALAALRTAHYHLAVLALRRGWWDEALAQTDWLLANAPQGGRLAGQRLQIRAYAEAGRYEAGQTTAAQVDVACDRALAVSHDLAGRGLIACVRAWRLLTDGKPNAARQEAVRAVRLRPSNLRFKYWSARAESREALQQFADAEPGSVWGQQARTDLARATPPA